MRESEREVARVMISQYLEDWDGLSKASIVNYAESGKVSGTLLIEMITLMDAWHTYKVKKADLLVKIDEVRTIKT